MTKRFWVVLSFLVVWAVLTAVAVTWGTKFDWTDNVHIDYGFPLVWATQSLSTIIGPVDLWSVDISALLVNLIFWLGMMLIVVSVMLYFFNYKVSKIEKE